MCATKSNKKPVITPSCNTQAADCSLVLSADVNDNYYNVADLLMLHSPLLIDIYTRLICQTAARMNVADKVYINLKKPGKIKIALDENTLNLLMMEVVPALKTFNKKVKEAFIDTVAELGLYEQEIKAKGSC